MGGYGSGLYGSGAAKGKTAVEHCRSIDIRKLQRENMLLAGAALTLTWSNEKGEETGSISLIVKKDYIILAYKVNDEPIRTNVYLDSTKTGYGLRKWFLCPACNKRAAILYLKGKYFACRSCHELNYRSSQLSGDMGYYHDQLRKLCKRLGAEYDPTAFYPPDKPKGMHWKTYEKIAQRYMYCVTQRERLWLEGARRLL
ncbi:hypothetical protein DCC39_07520 [Pueribacillus theae]|uniref:Uncharacterized protein n=1 Tax=Pueribacillus theae TaxID=2171751 RepID=A0A2U1K3H7_9BACI|nr:hypothetical protein [Pueribacillus theae]PWA12090.1 hypothetical protein DCC39_07520 [Pueribacillus theae]